MMAPRVISLAATPRSDAAPLFPVTALGGTTPSLVAWVPGLMPPGALKPPDDRDCSSVPPAEVLLPELLEPSFFTEHAVASTQRSAATATTCRCPILIILSPRETCRPRRTDTQGTRTCVQSAVTRRQGDASRESRGCRSRRRRRAPASGPGPVPRDGPGGA